MANHREKLLEDAQKLATKGQHGKAIVLYQKVLAEDPRDVRILIKIGDLHTKLSQVKEATKAYQDAADIYIKQGFLPRAVALLKQILQASPQHLEIAKKLAQVYTDQSLISDALATYLQVKTAQLSRAELDGAIETMELMIALDEGNTRLHVERAETLMKAGRTAEAAIAFAEAADRLREQGRIVDYVRAAELAYQCAPSDGNTALRLGLAYLARRDAKRALAIVGPLYKAQPQDVSVLDALSECFRQLDQIPNAVQVLKEITRLHHIRGQRELALAAVQRVLALNPSDAQASRWVTSMSAAPPPLDAPPVVFTATPDPTKNRET